MTLKTLGMGIAKVVTKTADAFKSRGKKPAKWMVPKKLFKNPPYKQSKKTLDRNIESKKLFKIMNKGKN